MYIDMFNNAISDPFPEDPLKAARRIIGICDEHCNRQNQAYDSRFYEVIKVNKEESITTPGIFPVTEQSVSYAYDMVDCHEQELSYYYLEDDGTLSPVTVGRQQRINTDEEMPFYYACAGLYANGRQVGTVMYTDH